MPPINELHYFDRTLPNSSLISSSASERVASETWRLKALSQINKYLTDGDAQTALWTSFYQFSDHNDEWYKGLFGFSNPDQMTGEITPRYAICGDQEIESIYRVAPNAKLIFILRNPVDRFWSQCLMKYADGSLVLGDPQAMKLFDTSNGRPRGEYSKTIIRYCKQYNPDQMLVVFFDAIQVNPSGVLSEIYSFLGLSHADVDVDIASKPVNSASNPIPMPESLRSRIFSAYRREIEILAETFGGYPRLWLGQTDQASKRAAVVKLTSSMVSGLTSQHVKPLGLRPRRQDKIFCISMQRSGTTSVGDWLESHGLFRAGYPTSQRLGWTNLWMQGDFEAIFKSDEFKNSDLFEDDPWWCPHFYGYLAERFPESKFILLTRDPDAWFLSLCHHSSGYNPGRSDIHARIYSRERELHKILIADQRKSPTDPKLLPIAGMSEHYKAIYRKHTEDAKNFFKNDPNRFFMGSLNSKKTFIDLCKFARLKGNHSIPVPRSNARTEEMARALAHNQQLMP